MRLSSSYPDDLKAFRIAIRGPADLSDASVSTVPGLAAEATTAAFADRDAPPPFPFPAATGRGSPKDLYYTFEAGPGAVSVALTMTAGGATATVALFDENDAPILFEDGSAELMVSSTGIEQSATRQVPLDRHRRIKLRFSCNYPGDLTAYRLSIEGAGVPGAG